MKKRGFLTGYIFLISWVLVGQNPIPVGYFSSPLKIELLVTGSFGEVRPDHFHSGDDLSVQKKEGLPVYAPADGWVSRIKISPVGFGNALYIDHPNGFTTVYGHLQGYNDTIARYAHRRQYAMKSFEVDLFPANGHDTLRVKKGDLIGFAGNSGGSFGAHLHFELRDTKTERIINPLLFGFDIRDDFPPVIDFIKVYPENGQSYVQGVNQAQKFSISKGSKTEWQLSGIDTLKCWGSLSFGVQAFDYFYNQSDRNGWYSVNIFMDQARLFSMQVDSFSFDESRYVNASMDYADNYDSGSHIIRSRLLPGNRLSLHHTGKNNGIATFTDEKVHEVVVIVADIKGKKTVVRFTIQSIRPRVLEQFPEPLFADTLLIFPWQKVNSFSTPEIRITLPEGCLYDSLVFLYSKFPARKGMFSNLHSLHQPEVPLNRKMRVSINADGLPARLRSKALLLRLDPEGKWHSAGGSYQKGFVTSETAIFDSYAIGVDTIAPGIRLIPDRSRNKKNIRFTVSDNLSGIAKYRAEVNGEWALLAWDPKNDLMTYTYDEKLKPGNNSFKIVLEDEKGNRSSFSTKIVKK